MIVVVEGPSAAGKTTWCETHAPSYLPEPGRWAIERVLEYQVERWRCAVDADSRGEVVVLDGDPFKLYYSWANWQAGAISEQEWMDALARYRRQFADGDCGLADLVLYSDPGESELRRNKDSDVTRSRRNFEHNTRLRGHFRTWYEVVESLDPPRVVWEHPRSGLAMADLDVGPRSGRSSTDRFDELILGLPSPSAGDP